MKNLAIVFVLLYLSGCASVPVNYGKPAQSSKIGVILLVDKTPTHAHVGSTIFQNEVSDEVSTTDFHKKFEEKINTPLVNAGFSVKTITASQSLLKKRDSLFSYMSSNINFKDEIKVELNSLAKQSGLDFVILVYPTPGPAWPNSSAYIEGYGLYTRCFLGSCNAYALDYIDARIFDVKNNSSLRPMNSKFFSQQAMPSIIFPENVKDIKAAQIDEAGELALNNFSKLFNEMLIKSEFL